MALHNYILEGLAFRLRPVQLEDAENIVELRATSERTQFIHPIPSSVDRQVDWINYYYTKESDYYFIVEKMKDFSFEGTVALYDVNEGHAEWGRWVLRKGSLAAPESAMLIYRLAFELMNLDRVYCRTLVANKSVLSFHDRIGMSQKQLISNAFNIGGCDVDAIEHRMENADWREAQNKLENESRLVYRLLTR